MKRIFTLCIAICTLLTGFAQTDTTGQKTDTIKIGGMIIIRKPGNNDGESRRDRHIIISNNKPHKPSNVSTNWIIFDLGFANYNDKTNYISTAAQQFAPGSHDDRFKLRTGKSINVNI
ncbi:MAG: PorT family protein, partial [Chitinophagaceae bacterium]|nr:PorT family protein [Chitinophagaceae bacterium]